MSPSFQEPSSAGRREFHGDASGEAGSLSPHTADALFTALYRELHEQARRQLGSRGLAVGPSTLVHEVYLVVAGRELTFPDRRRFIAYATRTMRGLVIDHMRAVRSTKRGGGMRPVGLDLLAALPAPEDADRWLRLAEVLSDLERIDPRLAEVVDLRCFCGFSLGEIARMREVCERTVQRDWKRARLYLLRVLSP
jgi:RNA polymerase sigma factor (TIGR02999 family)